MLVHSVFFWLPTDCSAQQRGDFLHALQGLLSISDVSQGWVGPPSTTRKAVIDHTYDFGLTLLFANLAAHDRYQVDPLHKAFIAAYSPLFAKVQVYDMEHLG